MDFIHRFLYFTKVFVCQTVTSPSIHAAAPQRARRHRDEVRRRSEAPVACEPTETREQRRRRDNDGERSRCTSLSGSGYLSSETGRACLARFGDRAPARPGVRRTESLRREPGRALHARSCRRGTRPSATHERPGCARAAPRRAASPSARAPAHGATDLVGATRPDDGARRTDARCC